MSEILWNQNKFKQSSNYFSQFKNPFLLHPNFSNFFASLKWNSHLVSSQVFENMFGNMWNHLRVIGIASIDFIKYIVFELHAGVLEHVLAGILFLCNFLNLHLALFLNEYVLSVLHLHAFAPLKEGFTLYGLVESERGLTIMFLPFLSMLDPSLRKTLLSFMYSFGGIFSLLPLVLSFQWD